ncbi:MAG TPA: acyl-CoA dehydrogenase family protein [Spirochaetia bacterium]|nr:acyl-CoA dehydrogenase family protein [Spirochaetia bacterium]
MLYPLSEEQLALQKMTRDFMKKEVLPYTARWDEEEYFSRELFSRMARLGFTGLFIPEEYGGVDVGRMTAALIFEEMGRGANDTVYVSVHNMVASLIHKFGNEEQRRRWVVPLAAGEKLGAFCLTEPGAGSDAAAIQTSARPDGGGYVINGNKIFITCGGEADLYAVAVKTPRPEGGEGISIVLVEKASPGLTFGKKERKLGNRSTPTRELIFQDCRVPGENLLGGEGQGFKIFMSALDGGRVNVAAVAVGNAQAALEAALAYARDRVQFGQSIAGFQAVQIMLADMATGIEAARLLVYQAACLMDQGRVATKQAAMAKRFATDVNMKVALDAVQIFGGYGYMRDFPVERYLRDAKQGQIVEGTNQIQRLVIAREMLKE